MTYANSRFIRASLASKPHRLCLIAAMFLFHALGCGGRYPIATFELDDGSIVNRTVENEISVEGGVSYSLPGAAAEEFKSAQRCILDAQKRTTPGGSVALSLELKCITIEGLGLMPGRSLRLLIDRNEFVLSGEGNVRKSRDATGKYIAESLEYSISADLLRRIAEAGKVEVKVSGATNDLKGYFDSLNFERFARFVDEYLGDGS